MRNRIAAIVGAVALIVVAVVVRGLIAGDDGSGGSGGSSGGGGDGGRPVVACSPGVEVVCEALDAEGLVEAAPSTLDLDSEGVTTGFVGDVEVDAWITWNPAGALADLRAIDAPAWGDPLAVGSSALVLGSHGDLPASCDGDAPTWDCVTAGDDVIALGDPSTIDGLVRAVPIADALQPDHDFIYSSNLTHLRDLYKARTSTPGPLSSETKIVQPGFYQAIVTTSVAAEARQMTSVTPAGFFEVVLTVVPRLDVSGDWVEAAFARPAVQEAVRAAGVDPGSATLTGAPDAGQLYALRERLTGS